ncbi:MAG TPA: helix-turn-helix domain-containing protein [Planctomycetaceae bacterium]
MAKRKPRITQAAIVERFAARLRELRRSRGMTQAELARQAKVTLSYIGKLEAGLSAPGIDLVERLADALGVPFAEMVPQAEPPDSETVLREQARKLTATLVEGADRETLQMLNPLLARLLEVPSRRR